MSIQDSKLKQTGIPRRTFMAGLLASGALAATQRTARAQDANDRIGVGFIGCGSRARHHMGEVAALGEMGGGVEIVALCDVYRPRMEEAAAKYKAPMYADHHDLLADPNVDVVCIATPDHLHGQQTIDAVLAKKDVYCEKPFTHWRQLEVTQRAVQTVRSSGQIFQLGTQGLSDSAWQQMRDLVQQGLIGQPIHAECGYFRVGDWGERGMRIDDPNAVEGPDLNWKAFLGDAPPRDYDISRFFRWRMYEDYSGGPVTDLFPHSLTPVAYILGLGIPDMAVAIGGKYRYEEREVPDTCNMLLDYNGRMIVAVLGTQGNNHSGMNARGAGGRCPTIRGWDGTLTIEKSEDGKADEIVFRPTEGASGVPQRYAIDRPESVQQHWLDLLEGVRTRKQPKSDIDLALHVQTALIMAAASQKEGKVVRYDAGTGLAG